MEWLKCVLRLGVLVFLAGCAGQQPTTAPTFVGSSRCAECHQQQHRDWQDSHHHKAMLTANSKTVLGDFNEAHHDYFGFTSTFTQKDGKFYVTTEGPGGKPVEYEIVYTFGTYPLQQYLIEFPKGRYQALSLCWDTRPAEQGGQRWFHLYPGERVTHQDPLHWTGPNQNWNVMCAECHSTNLRKGYALSEDRYATTWSESNVSCEACHGPGSHYLDWLAKRWDSPTKGLVADLEGNDSWEIDPESGNARPKATQADVQIESCAPCHSRRATLTTEPYLGKPFLDNHLPWLLEEGLYYPDGRIQDEVYVYGSFLQSKMYQAGVACTDCHDPHTQKLRLEGNNLCLQCHQAQKYQTVEHHPHPLTSTGASCVECHMPARTYMVVDPRRDHSLRVPRPDLSLQLDTPDACTNCHTEKSNQWAAEAFRDWYGEQQPHHATTLAAGGQGHPGSESALIDLIANGEQPDLVRATALSLLPPNSYSPEALERIQHSLTDDNGLIRRAALAQTERFPPPQRKTLVWPPLKDHLKVVRLEATRLAAGLLAEGSLTEEEKTILAPRVKEYEEAQLAQAERPEAHLNLGLLYVSLQDFEKAEASYRTGLRLDERQVPCRANLADLYRLMGQDDQAEKELREGLRLNPDSPDLLHALGLLLVRDKKVEQAFGYLEKAAPYSPRYSYVYAVALQSLGRLEQAITVLKKSLEQNPNDHELLSGLIAFSVEAGDPQEALDSAQKLAELRPWDRRTTEAVEQLKKASSR